MPQLRLGVSLQPRWPLDDGSAALRAARHAEALGFDHVAVGNRLVINTDTQHATMESNAKGAGAANRVRSVLYPGSQGVGIFQPAPSKP